MSAAARRLLTPAEYLEIERQAETKSEFFAGEMFAIARCKYPHNRIKDNLATELNLQLRGGPCFALTSDMRVKVQTSDLYTYPDIVIICEQPQFEDDHTDTLLNPRVLVEVLSEATEGYDRGAKFAYYQKIPTLQEFVLVAQDRLLLERYVRQADGSWNYTAFGEPSQLFEFTSVPVRVSLSDIYRGVPLPVHPPR